MRQGWGWIVIAVLVATLAPADSASGQRLQRVSPDFVIGTPTQCCGGPSVDLAPLPGGGFVAHWYNPYPLRQNPEHEGLFVQRFDAAGVPVGDAQRFVLPATHGRAVPRMAGLVGGGYALAWAVLGYNGTRSSHIYTQIFGADGAALGPPILVRAAHAYMQAARVTGLADGGFVVAWDRSEWGSEGAGSMFLQRYDAMGVPVGTQVRANPLAGHRVTTIALASLAGGGFVATWSSIADPVLGAVDIFGQMFRADGSRLGPPRQLDNTSGETDESHQVAGLIGGGFVAVTNRVAVRGEPGRETSKHMDATVVATRSWGTPNPTQITDDASLAAGFLLRPTIISMPDGGFIVLWPEWKALRTAEPNAIFARRFRNNGTPAAPAYRLVTSARLALGDPKAVVLSNGNILVIWDTTLPDPGRGRVVGALFRERPFLSSAASE